MSDKIINSPEKPWVGRFGKSLAEDGDLESFVVYVSCADPQTFVRTIERHTEHTDIISALQQCHTLIDTFLAATVLPDMKGNELFVIFREQGPDPYIVFESGDWSKQACYFNAWSYAELACHQLCGECLGVPRALVSLKGRYPEYNRLQMSAHGLMWRQVRVTQYFEGDLLAVTEGTVGRIGLGSPYFSGREFDLMVELPVVFPRDGMDDVTFGIPYGSLEFVESETEYLNTLKNPYGAGQ